MTYTEIVKLYILFSMMVLSIYVTTFTERNIPFEWWTDVTPKLIVVQSLLTLVFFIWVLVKKYIVGAEK